MKIEIELLDDITSYEGQFEAVRKYIKENTIKINTVDFMKIVIAEIPEIKQTIKNTGERIKPECTWREYYVSCKKTKKGMYKFKVWNA